MTTILFIVTPMGEDWIDVATRRVGVSSGPKWHLNDSVIPLLLSWEPRHKYVAYYQPVDNFSRGDKLGV